MTDCAVPVLLASAIEAAGWSTPVNVSSTVVMIAVAVVGLWLAMRVVRTGVSLLALAALWLLAAALFGLPPIGGEGLLR